MALKVKAGRDEPIASANMSTRDTAEATPRDYQAVDAILGEMMGPIGKAMPILRKMGKEGSLEKLMRAVKIIDEVRVELKAASIRDHG